jgi:hypothetical protein
MKKILLMIMMLFISFSVYAGNISNLRDVQYCEIFLGFDHSRTMYVYNTVGLNFCPRKQWDAIDPEKIKKDTGATNIHLNGPRKWTIDGMKNSLFINSQIKIFNGISMREAGILNLPIRFLFSKPDPYTKVTIDRNTTWVYEAKKPVYELMDDEGNIYIMQSYSLQKEEQTLDSLSQLGSHLTLPKGWHFRTRILDKEYYLTPIKQKAVVVQDDFLNTYQLEIH